MEADKDELRRNPRSLTAAVKTCSVVRAIKLVAHTACKGQAWKLQKMGFDEVLDLSQLLFFLANISKRDIRTKTLETSDQTSEWQMDSHIRRNVC